MGKKESQSAHLRQEDRATAGSREVLKRFGLGADKRLGQHFLDSRRVVESIIEAASKANGVLEIGPGIGVLTRALCEASKEVAAIELDSRFVEVLTEVAPCAQVSREDALQADWSSVLQGLPQPRCIVSNMPYNITGPLLQKVCECRGEIVNAVLMMQKEVGMRVLAGPGTSERGALSVSMQLQFDIKKVCDAKAGAFLPPPKVDSVVLEFVPKAVTNDLAHVLKIVRQGFRQPRKTLANNLSGVFDTSKLPFKDNIRPHQLTNDDWTALANAL